MELDGCQHETSALPSVAAVIPEALCSLSFQPGSEIAPKGDLNVLVSRAANLVLQSESTFRL
jgi:hypothetical protein